MRAGPARGRENFRPASDLQRAARSFSAFSADFAGLEPGRRRLRRHYSAHSHRNSRSSRTFCPLPRSGHQIDTGQHARTWPDRAANCVMGPAKPTWRAAMITRKSLHRRTLRAVALASVACLFGTGTALAADADSAHHLKVSYSDLNLSTINGATTLYQRIEGAAHFVCGDEGRSLDEQMVWKTCYGNAVNHAVTQVNNPLLTSLYAKQYHLAPATAML